jgi:hypothetical protein
MVVVLLFLALRKKQFEEAAVVVLQNEIEVGIGVLDGKIRHVLVEEEIWLKVEKEDGAVVSKKIVK